MALSASALKARTAGSGAASSRRWRRAWNSPRESSWSGWSGRSKGSCATDWCGVESRGSAFRPDRERIGPRWVGPTGGSSRVRAMALDRQSIEKRDFPIGRRGYEPEAVDAHLARVAEEVEDLKRRAVASGGGAVSTSAPKSSPASIAQAASEQVRAIVE